MNRVVEVLMRRDGMSQEEATTLFKQTQQDIDDAEYDYEAVEDIMASNLGLEMDYIIYMM